MLFTVSYGSKRVISKGLSHFKLKAKHLFGEKKWREINGQIVIPGKNGVHTLFLFIVA